MQILREAGFSVVDVHTDFPNDEGSCALMGEMVALLQASRTVFSECLEDTDRIKKLVEGDGVIRGISTEMAKTCL